MSAWPESLPILFYGQYELRPVDPVARTDMEVGPKKRRRRVSVTPVILQARLELSQAQMATFQQWHHIDLLDGQAAFTMPIASGAGVYTVEAAFAEMWSASVKAEDYSHTDAGPGFIWDLSVKLELRSL